MALFPLEEVHFHLNEGGSPKRVVSGPVRVKCIDCVSGGFSAPLCIMFLGDLCRTAHFYTSHISSFLSHCLCNLVPSDKPQSCLLLSIVRLQDVCCRQNLKYLVALH